MSFILKTSSFLATSLAVAPVVTDAISDEQATKSQMSSLASLPLYREKEEYIEIFKKHL